MSEVLDPDEVNALAETARLFSGLLLFELDEKRLAMLGGEGMREALADLGVAVPRLAPPGPAREEQLAELGAQFYAALLAPTGRGAPPVASLWQEGRYEGAIVRTITDLAGMAGFDFDAGAARSAPIDHLGSLLLLWAEASERAPAVADVLAAEHLTWSIRPLDRITELGGLYGSLAAATRELVLTLGTTRLTVDE